jgi:hypothetical protein
LTVSVTVSAASVVLQRRCAFEGAADADRLDAGVLVDRHGEGVEVLAALVGLAGVEDRVARCFGDLARVGLLDAVRGQGLQALAGPDEHRAIRLGQQERDLARGDVRAFGDRDRQLVALGALDLLDRVGEVAVRRLLLGQRVALAVVRERSRHGVDDRPDLQRDEQHEARQEVLHRHGTARAVDREEAHRDESGDDHAQPGAARDQLLNHIGGEEAGYGKEAPLGGGRPPRRVISRAEFHRLKG